MPIVSGGGGGTFNGGTVTLPTTIDVGSLATAGGLEIQGTSGANVKRLGIDFLHTALAVTGDGTFTVASDDSMGMVVEGDADSSGSLIVQNRPTTTQVALTANPSGGIAQVTDTALGTVAAMSYAYGLLTARTTVPADGSLAAGQCALWFDQTDGAAKLMVKGKSANGTVVAASIALA